MPGTCTIASKLELPLWMQLQEKRTTVEPTLSGPKEVDYHRHVGKRVRINGVGAKRVQAWVKKDHGFALTENVDFDFAAKWFEQNKDNDAVINHFIFMHAKLQDAQSEVKNMRNEKSGFEPLDPDNLPSEFSRRDSKITTLERNDG